ncbi:hypothetical protein EDC18_1144 [Natranaerovirga pectinivora]|uniref:Uncharacterized protein n=1 Tax=Natranaerovirga pectinivora TaxID=682400 RepID=A0A4R3MK16_9FIRM|nr:hypothetical protein [Natranaerovirga pectinivora]TCT12105.1 hypothetical protein EDC18_1144 [Natranaerovirga pectinivora]
MSAKMVGKVNIILGIVTIVVSVAVGTLSIIFGGLLLKRGAE